MEIPELLAPAGNLEKLKIAVLYGADAVYVGGKAYSLREAANNFSIEELKEGLDFEVFQKKLKLIKLSSDILNN
jgi:putative protease